ncbi:adenylate/guanylate cyclase domain-containing protein [Achromobacter mucicolens]|uniref:adenylate/guanylate cyclase domain-containing protein n=1 Tax=Achromobacter mucicolens TaxID=1389922 RepID=UPI0022F3A363|nr:adenylate/guanylate cyclase domain-containing protein [Achromobacter mucicolens]WBX89161.1 adenylate/guanylate cyclase domain-containing protein [Achromobacter mucicolens]
MNFDKLDSAYWSRQVARMQSLQSRLREREDALANGRVIPDGTDLALGSGRRLPMAVMFIDICGFSKRRTSTFDEQQDMLAALNLFFTEMIRIATDYGGTVEKNTGDGLMAYFEEKADLPHEGGAKRAVACALTMMLANERLVSPALQSRGFEPFSFRASIDYGYVTIANLGVARNFSSYAAIGSTANFAAKMLVKAKAGEIVIGQNVRWKLPVAWHEHTIEHSEPTGWHLFGADEQMGPPYLLYKYTGRWIFTPPLLL